MQKNKLNLHICGIRLLNPYKTVVSHLKLIDRKVAKEKLTDGQSNLLFSNQAHALYGAIHGAIFP